MANENAINAKIPLRVSPGILIQYELYAWKTNPVILNPGTTSVTK